MNLCFEANIWFFLKCGWLPAIQERKRKAGSGDVFLLRCGRHLSVWSLDETLTGGKVGGRWWSEHTTIPTSADTSPSLARALQAESTLRINDIRDASKGRQDVAVAEGFPPSHYFELYARRYSSAVPNAPHVKPRPQSSRPPSPADERPSKRQKG